MARHRNIRSMNYDDEYDDYTSDDYGISLDNGCVTPETEHMYTYARDRHGSVSKIWEPQNPPVKEEEEEDPVVNEAVVDTGEVADEDVLRYCECLEKMRDITGGSVSEDVLREAAKSQNFDAERALEVVFGQSKAESQKGAKSSLPENKKTPKQTTPIDIPTRVPPIDIPTRISFTGTDNQKSAKRNGTRPVRELEVEKEAQPKRLSPDAPKDTPSPKPTRSSKIDPERVQAQYDKERGSGKPLINLVVVGHVDAGKSTLMGHLLYLTGNVNKKTMDKYEHESKKLGKASFAYAWVLDETSEERERGITMDMAHAKLETEHRTINILDAPGHKDFIPNMIIGAAQADVAVLVVNATRGEFETGFELGGQTREHTMLLRALGVSRLAVAVNKLDTCQWSEDRFKEITNALKPFLKQTGYSDQVSFVPCSGLAGQNLHQRSKVPELIKWYNGPSLIEVIDEMKPPSRPVTKPLRMCVNDIFKGMQAGVCVAGKIESGSMSPGDKLIIMPSQEPCVVKSVLIDDLPQVRAFAGDSVTAMLDKCDPVKISSVSVLSDPIERIKVVSKFEAQIVVFNVETPITKGCPVVLHFHSLSEQAHVGKLVKEISRSTCEVVKLKPRFLKKNSSGVVVIKVSRPICLELFKDSKELGRIALRQGGQTIAAGIVTDLLLDNSTS